MERERETYQTRPNGNIDEIEKREEDLPRRGEPNPSVHVQPEHAAEAVGEPGREERGDQTEQVAEDGDGLGDDPGEDPEEETDADPGADGDPVALVHAVGSAKDADVDVLEGDVAVDDAGDDDLRDIEG